MLRIDRRALPRKKKPAGGKPAGHRSSYPIDATSSSQKRDEKSEWSQALQYAIRKKTRGAAFKNFLKRNGGPSGCAKKMAALRKKKLASKQSLGARTWGKKKSSSPTKGARQPFGSGS